MTSVTKFTIPRCRDEVEQELVIRGNKKGNLNESDVE
jgi:hypothetical protein